MRSLRLEDVDLNLLVTLRAVLREGSVRKAAVRLRVTQSAVSHALRRLRDAVGDPLVVATRDGVVPTALGARIGEAIERSLSDLEASLQRARGFDPTIAHRTFTLASADLAELVLLPGLVTRLSAKAPGIHIAVRPPPDSLDAALEKELDLALGVIASDTGRLRRRALFRDHFVCVLRRDHPAAKRPLDLGTWLALRHVAVAPRGGRTLVDHALDARGLARTIAVQVPHFLIAPILVADSDLALTLPSLVAARVARTLPLTVVEPPLELTPFTIHAAWHERLQDDPAHAFLRSELFAVARAAKHDEPSASDG